MPLPRIAMCQSDFVGFATISISCIQKLFLLYFKTVANNGHYFLDRDSFLLGGVAVADGYGVVFEGPAVDGHDTEGGGLDHGFSI